MKRILRSLITLSLAPRDPPQPYLLARQLSIEYGTYKTVASYLGIVTMGPFFLGFGIPLVHTPAPDCPP